MSMQDPIADMIAQIKNGQLAAKKVAIMPASKLKICIAKVLRDEGYIESFDLSEGKKPLLTINLKYYKGQPVIKEIKRVSRPGLRFFSDSNNLPTVAEGLGISIVSTSQGVMADRHARQSRIGGEVICTVF